MCISPIKTMAGDKAWLAKSLADALGWDLPSVEPVVDAISAAQSQSELDELIQVAYVPKANTIWK